MTVRFVLTAAALCASAAAQPAHYKQADQLITALLSDSRNVNIYENSSQMANKIDWSGDPRTAITVCSTFINLLLKHTYNYSDTIYAAKFGSSSPTAAGLHDAIVNGKGFSQVPSFPLGQQGDIIAVQYPAGQENTGHVMMVQHIGTMQPRALSTQHFLDSGAHPELAWYMDVTVMDSSTTFHGPTDTRALKPGGIGRGGIARFYFDLNQHLKGYTWSTDNYSDYKAVTDGYLVALGRLL